LTPPRSPYSAPDSTDPKDLYLHLLKLTLTGLAQAKPMSARMHPYGGLDVRPLPPTQTDLWKRYRGEEVWPADAFTMVGVDRLENVQACVEDVLRNSVPGDLIETGVWRGGTTILMRALLKLNDVRDRIVYAADSFQGVPKPDVENFPADDTEPITQLSGFDLLAVPLREVKENFRKFDLLDEQIVFVKGWFRHTLPSLEGHTWSVIRLDGDLYESTIIALESLYPGLSVGGYLIVDDYGGIEACRQAVHDYRAAHKIEDEICGVDSSGVYWQKTRPSG
jgi:O-methyltransferase